MKRPSCLLGKQVSLLLQHKHILDNLEVLSRKLPFNIDSKLYYPGLQFPVLFFSIFFFVHFTLLILSCFSLIQCTFLVENLNVLVPKLLNKLKVVENKKPVNNVTTNIVRIRELIAQARSVAKKVSSSFGTCL